MGGREPFTTLWRLHLLPLLLSLLTLPSSHSTSTRSLFGSQLLPSLPSSLTTCSPKRSSAGSSFPISLRPLALVLACAVSACTGHHLAPYSTLVTPRASLSPDRIPHPITLEKIISKK